MSPRPTIVPLLTSLLVAALAGGCGAGDGAAPDGGPGPGEPDARPADPRVLSGAWTGEATVADGPFLVGGTTPVRAFLYQHGAQLRGFVDLEQTEAGTGLVDSPSYFLDGELDAAGAVLVRLTERFCGAGEPVGLCYPDGGSKRLVYEARGTFDAGQLVLSAAAVIEGSAPLPGGIAFEPPFLGLTLDHDVLDPVAGPASIVGTWRGSCHVPRDVVYPLPLPMVGDDVMEIRADADGVPVMTRFDSGQITYWPADEPILLGDTLKLDAATGYVWFVQLWSQFSRWLYVGRQEGDTLKFLLLSDELDPALALWSEAGSPTDPLATALVATEGMCAFERVR